MFGEAYWIKHIHVADMYNIAHIVREFVIERNKIRKIHEFLKFFKIRKNS